MTLPMFFAESGALDTAGEGSTLTVSGDEGRHAVTVKRIQSGEQVLIADGSGSVANCTVMETKGKDSLIVRVDSWGPSGGRADLTVVLALIKGERMERAVEQLTEVGVGTIIPWASERSVVSLKGGAGDKIHKRLERKAYEAAKQCRQSSVPEVLVPQSTAELTELLQRHETGNVRDVVVFHEEATVGLSADDAAAQVLIIGPEGGLAPAEIEMFEQRGAKTRLMGQNVMRAGTAAVVGAAWCILHR